MQNQQVLDGTREQPHHELRFTTRDYERTERLRHLAGGKLLLPVTDPSTENFGNTAIAGRTGSEEFIEDLSCPGSH